MRLCLYFLVIIIGPLSLTGQIHNAIPYRKGDLWGYCDSNKTIILPIVYSNVEVPDYYDSSKTHVKISGLNEKLGLFDLKTRQIIFDTIYDDIIVLKKIILAKTDNIYSSYNLKGKKLQTLNGLSFQEKHLGTILNINTPNGSMYCFNDTIVKTSEYKNIHYHNPRFYIGERDKKLYFLTFKNNEFILADTTPYIFIDALSGDYSFVGTADNGRNLLDTLLKNSNELINELYTNVFYYETGRNGFDSLTISDDKSVGRFIVCDRRKRDKYFSLSDYNTTLSLYRTFYSALFSSLFHLHTDNIRLYTVKTNKSKFNEAPGFKYYYSCGIKYICRPTQPHWAKSRDSNQYNYINKDGQIEVKTNFVNELSYGQYFHGIKYHNNLSFLYNDLSNISIYDTGILVKSHWNFRAFIKKVESIQEIEQYLYWVKDSGKTEFYVKNILGIEANGFRDSSYFVKMIPHPWRINHNPWSIFSYPEKMMHRIKDTLFLSSQLYYEFKSQNNNLITNGLGETIINLSKRSSSIYRISDAQKTSLYQFAVYDSTTSEQIFFSCSPIRVKRIKSDRQLHILLNGTFYIRPVYQRGKKYPDIKSDLLDSNGNKITSFIDNNRWRDETWKYYNPNLILFPVNKKIEANSEFIYLHAGGSLERYKKTQRISNSNNDYFKAKQNGKYYLINPSGVKHRLSKRIKKIEITNQWNNLNTVYSFYTSDSIYVYNKDFLLILKSKYNERSFAANLTSKLMYFYDAEIDKYFYFDTTGIIFYDP